MSIRADRFSIVRKMSQFQSHMNSPSSWNSTKTSISFFLQLFHSTALTHVSVVPMSPIDAVCELQNTNIERSGWSIHALPKDDTSESNEPWNGSHIEAPRVGMRMSLSELSSSKTHVPYFVRSEPLNQQHVLDTAQTWYQNTDDIHSLPLACK